MQRFFLIFFFVFNTVEATVDRNVPFIYVHGVGAPYQLFTLVSSLPKTFKKLGRTLYVAQTPATASIASSAEILEQEIKRLVSKGPYILIGHSMGGLVARAFLSHSPVASKCLALVTVSTPHSGSPVADWALTLLGRTQKIQSDFNPSLEEMEIVQNLLSLVMQWTEGNIQVLKELTTTYMQEEFPKLYPRRSGVQYFSIGHYIPYPQAYYSQIPYLLAAHRINMYAGYNNSDGPVPIESSRYGTHLGDFPGDHYATQGPIPFGLVLIHQQSFERLLNLFDRQFR
jgi:triacylglycerol lipase